MKKFSLSGMLFLLILASTICLKAAQTDVLDILKRSQTAENTCYYSGKLITTAYTKDGPISSQVNIFRSGEKCRMEYLTGASKGRVLLDDGTHVIRLDSIKQTAYSTEAPEYPQQMDMLIKNCVPVLQGSAKIAGRDCYLVSLKSKCSCDPMKRLWLDKHTGVALKTEKYTADGKLESSTVFTSVDYSKRPSGSLFVVPKGWKTVHPIDQPNSLAAITKAVGFMPIKPSYVPASYRFDNYYLRNTPSCKGFAGLRYTNGMNTISVFERKGPCPGQSRGRGWRWGRGGNKSCQQSCAVCLTSGNPRIRVAQRSVGDLAIIVVGDISEVELKKIANSIH